MTHKKFHFIMIYDENRLRSILIMLWYFKHNVSKKELRSALQYVFFIDYRVHSILYSFTYTLESIVFMYRLRSVIPGNAFSTAAYNFKHLIFSVLCSVYKFYTSHAVQGDIISTHCPIWDAISDSVFFSELCVL